MIECIAARAIYCIQMKHHVVQSMSISIRSALWDIGDNGRHPYKRPQHYLSHSLDPYLTWIRHFYFPLPLTSAKHYLLDKKGGLTTNISYTFMSTLQEKRLASKTVLQEPPKRLQLLKNSVV